MLCSNRSIQVKTKRISTAFRTNAYWIDYGCLSLYNRMPAERTYTLMTKPTLWVSISTAGKSTYCMRSPGNQFSAATRVDQMASTASLYMIPKAVSKPFEARKSGLSSFSGCFEFILLSNLFRLNYIKLSLTFRICSGLIEPGFVQP